VARRRHTLVVEDEGHLKDFIIIFVFVEMLCIVHCFLLMLGPFRKK
jgi:hypothetical protein